MNGRLSASKAALVAGVVSALAATESSAQTPDRLGELSIEELANVAVTSVSRRAQPIGEAPASIFVITSDDLERAGIRTFAAALRLAPNLQVARIGSADYAITSRGFNHQTGTANKLLVMIDGRIVYTPLYSGVFWDEHNAITEDIDRIEVVGGPGGTLWGANAVNGVINIVSRDAHETTGILATGGAGSNGGGSLALRYGARAGDGGAFRVYGLGISRGSSPNEWRTLQGGFRSDWSDARNTLTFQGDLYRGNAESTPAAGINRPNIDGGNLLARWSRRFSATSGFQVQAYGERANRLLSSGVRADVDAAAIDAQYNADIGSRHNLVLGGGWRTTKDSFIAGPGTAFLDPDMRTLNYANVFVQDTIQLAPSIDLIAGVKLEDNDYSGLEYLPNARVSWRITPDQLAWAAVSRAVRTPARLDREFISPGILAGGPDFESEDVVAYEAGYRAQPTENFWFSASAFYNVYSDLRTIEASTPTTYPLVIKNGMEGETYGLEAWGAYAITDWWRLNWGASWFHKDLKLKPGSRDVPGVAYAGNDPDYQFTLRSLMDLGRRAELDLSMRAIDELPSPVVPSYVTVDARLGYRLTDNVEVSLTGYNLTGESHVEFINPALPANSYSRSFFLSARWRY